MFTHAGTYISHILSHGTSIEFHDSESRSTPIDTAPTEGLPIGSGADTLSTASPSPSTQKDLHTFSSRSGGSSIQSSRTLDSSLTISSYSNPHGTELTAGLSSPSRKAPSRGAIVGIVLALFALLAVLGLLIYRARARRQRQVRTLRGTPNIELLTELPNS